MEAAAPRTHPWHPELLVLLCTDTAVCSSAARAATGIASPVGVSCDVRANSFKWAECPRGGLRRDCAYVG